MIKITLPGGYLRERVYAIHVLCYEFLGFSYTIEIAESNTWYCIEFEGRQIRIDDHFFRLYTHSSFLQRKAIPESAFTTTDPGLENIVCIYGEDEFTQTNHILTCGVDLVAGTFFMLSRWEEQVCGERDAHGRFPAEAALAVRAGFLHRPVVNEYVALLKKWLLQLGVGEEMFRKRVFQFSLHCDVDSARYYTSRFTIAQKILFQLVKKRSIAGVWQEISAFKSWLKNGHDPYHTFGTIMDLAEMRGGKASFCFLADHAHRLDGKQILSVPFVKQIFTYIRKHGHHTGIHFSYRSADQQSLITAEAIRYQSETQLPAEFSRQHYLRCTVPETWRGWEAAEVTSDSTMGYPGASGFRCGTCYPFPLFDMGTGRLLHVYERPLIAMDVTFKFYKNCTPAEAVTEIRQLMESVQKYDGEFVLLWHNSSFSGDWKDWAHVLETVMT